MYIFNAGAKVKNSQYSLQNSRANKKQLAVFGTALFGAFLFCAQPLYAQLMATLGKLEVNGVGGAVYSIPVDVPPGTAGMVPSISLQYNSQGGDGLLGVGWSITGLSEIDRCGKTLPVDGAVAGVSFTSNDRFCLDGQRLIGISGVYGADGSEYRTEIESFSKIVLHGSALGASAWWEIRTKAGQTIQYGNTTDSRAVVNGVGPTKSWLINRATDTKGNYLTYSYFNNLSYNNMGTGEVLPSKILYTGNAGGSLSPYNSVEFAYAQRPDVSSMYVANAQLFRSRRLTNITTKVGTSVVADYRIAYDQSPITNKSRVNSVTRCDAGGVCLPSVNFSWIARSGRGTFDQTTATYSDTPLGTPPRATSYQASGDFNGDGKTDTAFFYSNTIYTFLSQPDGTFQRVTTTHNLGMGAPPQGSSVPVIGDMNGDGKTDVAFFYSSTIRTFLSNGDGTFQQVAYSAPQAMGNPTAFWPLDDDFNGDGKTDVALLAPTKIYTYMSNGDGTYQSSTSTVYGGPAQGTVSFKGDFNKDGKKDIAFIVNGNIFQTLLNLGNGVYQFIQGSGISPSPNYSATNSLSLADDFNQDGSTDLVVFLSNAIVVWMSNGNGTFTEAVYNNSLNLGSPPSQNYVPAAGDFNGDGKRDFSLFGVTKVYSFLSKGNGTFETVQGSPAGVLDGIPPPGVPLAEDLDGDGKTDVAIFLPNNIASFLSKGDGTFQAINTVHNLGLGSPPSTGSAPLMGDFNGDGYADIAFFYNTTRRTFLNRIHTPELITGVSTPSYSATTSLDYKPLTDSTVYTKGTGAAYPNYDFQAPVYVVSGVTSPNGIGGSYASTYKYTGAKVHLAGRGFLGFSSQIITDSQTGVIQTTNFMQSFPYVGKVSSQTKVLGGVTLNSETNSYATQTLPWSGTYFPYISQKIIASNDLDGTVMPTATSTYIYDSYGNATQVVNSTSDGASQTINSTYTNDTTNWYLGRLSGSSTTNVTP